MANPFVMVDYTHTDDPPYLVSVCVSTNDGHVFVYEDGDAVESSISYSPNLVDTICAHLTEKYGDTFQANAYQPEDTESLLANLQGYI